MQQSAGYVIIDNDAGSVLCVRAYANWDFPKGHLEDGESHREAAIRETREEVTLEVGTDYIDIGIPSVAVTYGSGKKKKTATYFFADRVSTTAPFLPVSPELGKPENDESRWVAYDDLQGLLPGRLQPVLNAILDWTADEEID